MDLQRTQLNHFTVFCIFFQYGLSLWNKYLRMSITDIHIIDCFSVQNNALLFSAILCTSINAKKAEEGHEASKYFIR